MRGTCIKVACIRCTCFKGAGVRGVCVEGTCANNTCVRGTCAGNTSSAIDGYIKNTRPKSICIKSACIEGADRKSAYSRGAGAVKHSRIQLQFFSILEVGLFNRG